MNLTSILVYIDTTPGCDIRMDLAFRFARRCDAHLTGAGLEEAVVGPGDRFDRLLRQEQISGEWQTIIGLPESYLSRYACAHDLVVVGQSDDDDPTALAAPENVVLSCGRPVLMVPSVAAVPRVEGNILIAWNGSREAMRAVQDALPVMGLYDVVTVLSVNPEEDADVELQTKLIEHLARHGLNAVPETSRTASGAVSDTILGRAVELDAGAIVMGAYGHSRLREVILGGVTRDMLLDTSRPLLMSH